MKKPWFKYDGFLGWGWRPVRWQGWLFTIAYAVATVLTIAWFDRDSRSVTETLMGAFVPVLILSAIYQIIAHKTGVKPEAREPRFHDDENGDE